MPRRRLAGRPGLSIATRWARLAALAAAVLVASSVATQAALAAPSSPTGTAPAPGGASTGGSRATFGIGPLAVNRSTARSFFSYQTGPGGTYSDKAAAVNYATTPLTVTVYPADLGNAADGTLAAGLQTDKLVDAGRWVTLSQPSLTITIPAATSRAPGVVIIPFALTVPGTASPGDHGAALIATLSTIGKNPKGQNVRLDQRVATSIYVRVAGPLNPKLAIEALKGRYHGTLDPIGKGRATVTYRIRNTGNVRVKVQQAVNVTGLFGAKTKIVRPPAIEVLFPGSTATVTVEVPGVVPTVFDKARVTVTPQLFADQKPVPVAAASASAPFFAFPWMFLACVAGLILLVVLYLWWRRHLRRRPPASHSRRRPRGGGPNPMPSGGPTDLPTTPSQPRDPEPVGPMQRRESVRLRPVAAALLAGGLVAGLGLVAAPGAGADGAPFTDPNALGALAFCDASGHEVISGLIDSRPFAGAVVSTVGAPAGFGPPSGLASVFAYQPIKDVDPGSWSGRAMTGASKFSNSAHPMAQPTILDPSMKDFVGAFPTKWDGLVQFRMLFSAPADTTASSPDTYPAAVIRVSGDRWSLVSGGGGGCGSGTAVSNEIKQVPQAFGTRNPTSAVSNTSRPGSGKAGSTSATSSSSPSGAADASGGTSSPGNSPVAASTNTTSSSGTPVWLWFVIAAAVLAMVGGTAWWLTRRQSGAASPPVD
ncbi:MAG: hypothetical protein QOE97_2971 [Pseudonocardiales bacterium]|nr:hypothetical protein [Pseudonocardiales bacterium]